MLHSKKRVIVTSIIATAALIWGGCSEDAKPKTTPTVVTGEVSGISANSATANGEVVSDGNVSVSERGIVLGTSPEPTISGTKVVSGSGVGIFSASLTGLFPGTTYHVRAFATNAQGTSYGVNKSFTTGANLATVTTAAGTSITLTSVTIGGTIATDGGAAVTVRGVVYSTLQNPTLTDSKTIDGSGTGAFTSVLTGLKPSTVYYVRAYATNSAGTAYGSPVVVTTLTGAIDVEGNVYPAVVIGTQTWLKENLKVGKYRNGDEIPNITDDGAWSALTTGAFVHYNNDVSNSSTYGRLYNWYAAVDPRGLCPSGWHVPSDTEWTTLTTFLGGDAMAGGKMKSTGTTLWTSPNTDATNESGFSALPAGNRDYPGPFYSLGTYTYWWSSTENGSSAWDRGLTYNFGNVLRFSTTSKNVGYSVRCIRD